MITLAQVNEQLKANIDSMEEGVIYVHSDENLNEVNKYYKEQGWVLLEKNQYQFRKVNGYIDLSTNNGKTWNNKYWKVVARADVTFAFAFSAVAFAFADTPTKLKKDDCDGKTVEIEGKKYKLVLQ